MARLCSVPLSPQPRRHRRRRPVPMLFSKGGATIGPATSCPEEPLTFVTKKMAIYAAIVVVLMGALFLGRRAYVVDNNKPDMANLLAIAGLSGAKIFTLDPTPELMNELRQHETNPKEAVAVLERALKKKTAQQAAITKSFPNRNSPEARDSLETGVAYSFRILLLMEWKPGMSRKEIVQHYQSMTKDLNSIYDLKNHTEDFFGFQ